MAFGMKPPVAAVDFPDIIKYDANAGRLFRIDYNLDAREKVATDITTPAPRFAVDFGSLEVGYAHFSSTGPDYRVVPEGKPLPVQPMEKDDKGKLLFRPAFRLKIYGKVLSGLREWASAANCVLEAVDDLYNKFRVASEAAGGQIPIVELSKTIPVIMGRGPRQRTVYTPCFAIVGWTTRVTDMGDRTVPPPLAKPPTPGPAMGLAGGDIDDEIPF